ncbi:hypothetical protein BDN72DRAFT_848263 [Pluteus cervinus]|uniref:Uncharacterized protein n=2 Tax=Pluteus cervinus TaxID=181527 RepID=A0ACD3A4L1_9AGAR|nr:hypothetical protein BDN72DRAFT_850343 [Pluteus cervinus]TFK62900.1 hypothetical protein BDN72DRAFT_848263 [Pluteus cervinus]
MIIDEKAPPPPYYLSSQHPPARSSRSLSFNRPPATLSTIPSHLLLQIVYSTFLQTRALDKGVVERQRKTLYWLSIALRLVDRSFYIACMHVLRSTYLPTYNSLIRPPYTSDPFPAEVCSSARAPQSISSLQRETSVLDLFIAVKVREDVWLDDSELHLEREESFKDLFDLSQPKSRLEDLVRAYGVREGVVTLSPPNSTSASSSTGGWTTPPNNGSTTSLTSIRPSASTSSPSSSPRSPLSPFTSQPPRTSSSPRIKPIPFSLLSISFSIRKVGLIMTSSSTGRKKTIVEVQRSGRDEKLEVAAKRVVRELKAFLVSCR